MAEQLVREHDLTVTIDRGDDRWRLAFAGRLDSRSTGGAWRSLVALATQERPAAIDIDATAVTYCDGAGAALLLRLRLDQEQRSQPFTLRAGDDLRALLGLYHDSEEPDQPKRARPRYTPPVIVTIGKATRSRISLILGLFETLGEFARAFAAVARRPRRLRWRDVLATMELVGVDAVPIAGLMGFLIGLILAFQSAIPLRKFGADLYVANLVGMSVLREIGPLLTGVVLAGRSGSAFAAEIGTMKVSEEVDALTTMGLDPVSFLVVPRMIAAVLMTPLVAIWLEVCALVGGGLVVVSFGFAPATYVSQIKNFAHVGDLLGGLIKAVAFGLLIAGIGCVRGLQTGSGASAVGGSTTSAVVTSLVAIILADGVFAVVFYYVGW